MNPLQNFGKEEKLLSTKARLVVLDVLFSAVCQKLHFLSGTKLEVLLAAVHLTGGPHSLFESPVFFNVIAERSLMSL